MALLPTPAQTNDLIFISIASYRDAQLTPTVLDCIAKAARPQRLRFGICWQHGKEEGSPCFSEDSRVRLLDIDWRNSRGACWARAEIMKLWQGEHWFLQVDSHCRFAPRWDERLIREMAQTGSPKPILSTYPPQFTPATGPEMREALAGKPQLMALQTFTHDNLLQLKPIDIPGWQKRTEPMRARFLAAGFLLTLGTFIEEVGYDPELYFFGEEIAMTLRAFTHGYDLFHPYELLVWHDYVRSYAIRHWDDHKDETKRAWTQMDARSRDKISRMLRGEPIETFGLGAVRSLEDYEAYAGLSFRERKAQDYTRRALEPPNPPAAPNWMDAIYTWMVRILIDPQHLTPFAFEDTKYWYVTIEDKDGTEIYRRDFLAQELAKFTGKEPRIALVCELESGIIPAAWTVWPVSVSKGWLTKLQGKLGREDFAIIREDDESEKESEIKSEVESSQPLEPVNQPNSSPMRPTGA